MDMINMQNRIENLSGKNLIGIRVTMSLVNNKTAELWRAFMIRRKEITNNLNNNLISMSVYPPGFFSEFNPVNRFEKWAVAEVNDFEQVPDGMEAFTMPEGLYVVFHYVGSGADNSVFRYIFEEWLPGSAYMPDNRPHFEILGEKYKNNDENSEEEIWIPIRLKS